jgi:hypothetical protein
MYENQEKKRAHAINAAVGRASTGTHQIAIEFEYRDEPGGITYYGPLTDAAFEFTMKAIRTAGFEGDDISDLSSLCNGAAPDVMLVIGPEEYNGKTTIKVKFINSLGGLALKDALQGDDLTQFARTLKGKIIGYDRSAGATKAAPRVQPSSQRSHAADSEPSPFTGGGSGGDDIPFGPLGNF